MDTLQTQLDEIKVSQKQYFWEVNKLIEKFINSEIIVPEYQRNLVWDTKKQYRFIESIFMDVPI